MAEDNTITESGNASLQHFKNAKHAVKGARKMMQEYLVGVYYVMGHGDGKLIAAHVSERLNQISHVMAQADRELEKMEASATGPFKKKPNKMQNNP